jgi:hypothetical protein
MSITEQGIAGEKKAREWLLKHGYKNHQQLDWIVKSHKTDKYFIVEAKHRELFEPPPFLGTGLDIRQINLRRQLYQDLGIDTRLVVFTKDKIYHNFIFEVLEKTEYFDTRNNIRIYNIKNFMVDSL